MIVRVATILPQVRKSHCAGRNPYDTNTENTLRTSRTSFKTIGNITVGATIIAPHNRDSGCKKAQRSSEVRRDGFPNVCSYSEVRTNGIQNVQYSSDVGKSGWLQAHTCPQNRKDGIASVRTSPDVGKNGLHSLGFCPYIRKDGLSIA